MKIILIFIPTDLASYKFAFILLFLFFFTNQK